MDRLDKILVLNLKRRLDRREACEKELEKLRLSPELRSRVQFVDGVDGSLIDDAFMKVNGYELWPHWKRPDLEHSFYRREIRKGEIGCALSHRKAWQQVVDEDLEEVLIIEDDAIFVNHFRFFLNRSLEWVRFAKEQSDLWDLLYVGRSQVMPDQMQLTTYLAVPGYSYCAHAYVITNSGCRKLLSVDYEKAIIPVDEFIPAMYHQHPRTDVALRFQLDDPIHAYAITPSVATQANVRDSDTEFSIPLKNPLKELTERALKFYTCS